MKKDFNKIRKGLKRRWKWIREENKVRIRGWLIVAGFCFLAPFFFAVTSWDTATGGQVGDMFGAVNALFSGLALLGAIVALLFQGKELALQREEMKLTRLEMTASTEQFKLQNELLRQQISEEKLSREELKAAQSIVNFPNFIERGHTNYHTHHDFSLRNQGKPVQAVVLNIFNPASNTIGVQELGFWASGDSRTIQIANAPCELTFRFKTLQGVEGETKFSFEDGKLSEISAAV